MFKKIKSTCIAIVVSAATLGASVPSASAGSATFEFRFGSHGHAPFVQIIPNRHQGFRAPSSHTKKAHRAKKCSFNRAVKKARNKFGVRHAHVVRANHKRIVVKGMKRGHRVRVVFANQRKCPVISRRAIW